MNATKSVMTYLFWNMPVEDCLELSELIEVD